ncbi:CCHC-type domain-containing protein [Nephila pilipes]|uniref:CCHC-type domain-containing protein n=1 Tax=Nephila pilipes TaxID=299642 RepID=A0A8X6ML29_NEPPI|nr:CCHC-type domain-containing protein [Nephila pilipes]
MNHKFNVRGGSTRRTDNSRTFNSATSNDRGEPRCFACNKFGHVLRDCPFPCTLCGESGHTKKYCTKNKNEPRANTLSVCDRESSSPNKYLRTAHINNHEVTALLDTGSSSCLLKESVAANLGLKISPCKTNIFSFGNQLNPVSQSLGATVIDFQIEDVVGKDIYVLIVPDSTQPVDLIVGRPFLDLSYIAYARVGEKLHIGYAKDYPFINSDYIDVANNNQPELYSVSSNELDEAENHTDASDKCEVKEKLDEEKKHTDASNKSDDKEKDNEEEEHSVASDKSEDKVKRKSSD